MFCKVKGGFRCRRFCLCLFLGIFLVFQLSSCANYSLVFPSEADLDLTGFELVFYDDFEGDSLDFSIWESRLEGQRRGGFNHSDQIAVADGNLVLTAEYKESEYGVGWHTAMIQLRKLYTYGYYEIRCLPNSGESFWSAFWLQSENSYKHELSQGGIGGAEIDIFETYKSHSLTTKDFITSSIHCNGFDSDVENIDSERVAKVYVPNLRSEYTTYGLMWTESEYIFYVNGRETARTSFAAGTSRALENVIVSLEVAQEIDRDTAETETFLVDYVKIYQMP